MRFSRGGTEVKLERASFAVGSSAAVRFADGDGERVKLIVELRVG